MKIRYYGHAGQLTGYGRAAEMMILALLRAGADVEIRTLAPYDTLKQWTSLPLASYLRTDAQLDPSPDVVIVHTLPMDCPRVVQIAAETIRGSRPLWVAYTTWEAAGKAPADMVRAYEVFDDVWHPSAASAESFVGVDPSVPQVRTMPHCFDESMLPMYQRRITPAPEAPYRFYTIGAFNARKNPIAVIRAFAHAFDKTDDVELLMVCQGMTVQQLTHAICSTGMPPNDLPPIRSDFKAITDEEIWKIHRGADCFVSASRGEAWNLPAFEAMLAGRHVIAPAYLGHEAFLRNTSADLYLSYKSPALVDTRVIADERGTQVQTVGAQGLTSKSCWREPDILELAKRMRESYEARRRTITVEYDIKQVFGAISVGEIALGNLEHLMKGSP